MHSTGVWPSNKGPYRLYDQVQQKVLHSRDVRFNENEKDSGVSTKDDEGHSVVLDLSCDPESEAPTANNTHDEDAAEPVLRRSTRERHPPSYYGMERSYLSIHGEPVSIKEATTCPDSSKWIEAMETEMKSLKDNDVWELVDLPTGKKAIRSKWVYKVKTGADGSIEHFKARLFAQGFTQNMEPTMMRRFAPW